MVNAGPTTAQCVNARGAKPGVRVTRVGCGSAGFTLLELLAVMAIVGIMMLAATASFVGMGSGEKIRSSVIQLKGTLVSARQTAITKRARASVIYSNDFSSIPPRGLYWIVITNSLGQPEEMMGEYNYLAPGLTFSNNALFGKITFKTDGGCPGATASNIVVYEEMKIKSGGEGRVSRIRIYPLTGQTKIMN